MGFIYNNPKQTLKAIQSGTVNAAKEFAKADSFEKGRIEGRIGGEIALAFVGTKGIDKLAKVGKGSKLLARTGEVAEDVSKIDFIVSPAGTAVHASHSKMIKSITKAGATRVGPATATTEVGEIFKMNTFNGPMEIRVMQGRPNGGPFQGPRTIVTRPGTREYVHPNGARIEGAVPKSDRMGIGHIHDKDHSRKRR